LKIGIKITNMQLLFELKLTNASSFKRD